MVIGNNIKATLSHIDPNLELNQSTSCHLSIQVNLQSFTYAVLNIKAQKYIAIEHYDLSSDGNYVNTAEAIDLIIADHPVLQKKFKSISSSFSDFRNTLVPKDLFEKKYCHEILSFNHYLLKNEQETSDWISSIQAYNLYSIPEELTRCFKKHFNNTVWHHDSTIFIESLFQQFKLHENEKIYLSIQDTYFEMAVLKEKKLKFFNNFSYKTAEDFIYYLLFSCEQLNLNPEQIHLMIFGEINSKSEVYKLIFKYVRNIQFSKRNINYNYSFVFDKIKEHFYYKLLNQHLCVS